MTHREGRMKLCRYNDNKLGVVEAEQLIDVSEALEAVPETRWPRANGDKSRGRDVSVLVAHDRIYVCCVCH